MLAEVSRDIVTFLVISQYITDKILKKELYFIGIIVS
jgi:hypothetical protein